MQMTPMTPEALDAFFRDRHVAVLAVPRADRPPLTSPIWYEYDGRVFRAQVDPDGAKTKLIASRGAAQVSLTIQSEVPPYRYAVVYGTATVKPNDDPTLRRRVARRYMGRIAGDQYVTQELRDGRDEASLRVVEIVPERVVSCDFGPDAGWLGRTYLRLWSLLHPVRA